MKNFTDGYDYSLAKIPFGKYWAYGHNGGVDEFRSSIFYFLDLKIAASCTVNQSDMNVNDILISLLETAAGQDFEMHGFKTFNIPENELQKLTGKYASTGIPVKFDIFIRDKKLMAQASGQGEFPLEPVLGMEFKFALSDIAVEFFPERKQLAIMQSRRKDLFTKE